MLYIIDDRIKRQNQYLSRFDKGLFNVIKPFSSKEIDTFRKQCKSGEAINILKEARLVAAHESSLFEIPKYKDSFENYCRENHLPVIFFSGGYTINTTIIQGILYSANVAKFYTSLGSLKDESHLFNPDIILFGEKHLLSRLMNFRRRINILNQNGEIEIVADEISEYEDLSEFTEIAMELESNKFSFDSLAHLIQQKINKILSNNVSSNL